MDANEKAIMDLRYQILSQQKYEKSIEEQIYEADTRRACLKMRLKNMIERKEKA